MASENTSRTHYDEARRNFDDLDVEEQVRFLVEGTASTLAHGLLQAGEAVAEGLEDALRQARKRSPSTSETGKPGAAEPETARRQAPRRSSPDSTSET